MKLVSVIEDDRKQHHKDSNDGGGMKLKESLTPLQRVA